MGRGDLTAVQWAVLEPLLPVGKKSGRQPKWTKRQPINGISPISSCARRRKQTTPRGQGAQGHGRDDEAVREYEEAFTTLLMQQGLPKMTARVLTCLFTADTGSLTASELVQHLQVSPASVSKAIAFLEDQGLIRRERDERRRERYFVDEDVWYQSTIASARGITQIAQTARQGVSVLGRDTPAAARLENIARFSDFISESMLRAAEQVHEVLHIKPGTTSNDTAQPSPDHGQPAVSIITELPGSLA